MSKEGASTSCEGNASARVQSKDLKFKVQARKISQTIKVDQNLSFNPLQPGEGRLGELDTELQQFTTDSWWFGRPKLGLLPQLRVRPP